MRSGYRRRHRTLYSGSTAHIDLNLLFQDSAHRGRAYVFSSRSCARSRSVGGPCCEDGRRQALYRAEQFDASLPPLGGVALAIYSRDVPSRCTRFLRSAVVAGGRLWYNYTVSVRATVQKYYGSCLLSASGRSPCFLELEPSAWQANVANRTILLATPLAGLRNGLQLFPIVPL
jgi:hypothetical protein